MNDPVALQVASRIYGKPRGRPVWTSAGRRFVLCPGRRFKGRLLIHRCATLRAELNRSLLDDLQFIVPETCHQWNDNSPSAITDPAMRSMDTQQDAMPVA